MKSANMQFGLKGNLLLHAVQRNKSTVSLYKHGNKWLQTNTLTFKSRSPKTKYTTSNIYALFPYSRTLSRQAWTKTTWCWHKLLHKINCYPNTEVAKSTNLKMKNGGLNRSSIIKELIVMATLLHLFALLQQPSTRIITNF